MSNNKQNSVDFFAEKIFNLIELMKSRYVNQEEFLDGILKARDQAKAIHNEQILKHIDYLKRCKQNLIDNSEKMPQHLLEGGCMAFESAIDNAEELFLGGNNEADNYYN